MNYQITPMQPEDYDAVRSLWEKSAGVGLDASDEREKTVAYLKRNPGLSRVVRIERRVVAATLCGHDGRRGYISHLAVDADYQNRGIGRKLVESCMTALSRLEILRCNVRIFADNTEAAAFWRRIGFWDRDDLKILTRDTTKSTQSDSPS